MVEVSPLGSYVLIKKEEKKRVSDGGIALPDGYLQNADIRYGVVADVGPECQHAIAQGDKVAYAASDFNYDVEGDRVLVDKSYMLAVIRGL